MKTKVLLGIAIASLMVSGAAAQQSPAPARDNPPAVVQPSPTNAPALRGQWRASKLIGVDVYNEQNEKLGDIDELIVDRSGKISGVVIGVGGFLGMGQRDIFIPMEKLKFVEEPLRSSTVLMQIAPQLQVLLINAQIEPPEKPGVIATTGIRTMLC